MSDGGKRNILILGAGFGGIYTAINLSRRLKGREDVSIKLVDSNRYHLFKPMLHEVATGSVDPTHIIQPIRTVMKGRGFGFVEGIVQRIDLAARKVYICIDCWHCSKINEMNLGEFDLSKESFRPLKSRVFEYDYLVIAVGSIPNFYGIPGAREHAFPLYSLDDAVRIREHVINAFEIADHMEASGIRKRLLTFVVAGAGPTGIELTTELYDWIFHTLLITHENVNKEDINLILLEAKPDILPYSPEGVREKAKRTLKEMGINIMTGSPVARVEKNWIEISDGSPWKIHTNSLFWTAGIKSSDLLDDIALEKDSMGRIRVNEYLEVRGVSGVYAIGDCASFQSEGMTQPLPQTGQVAVQEAACLVENIVRDMDARGKQAFKFRDMGAIVSLGERTAAANVFRFIGLSGVMGWFMWKFVYFKHLMGIHRRLRVVLDWFFDITYDREASRHKFG